MSFNNENTGNFQSNFQSTGTNDLRGEYNTNERSTGRGFDNDRGFQSNTGTGSVNSGFDRTSDRGFQSNTGTGSLNSDFTRTNDRSTGSGFNNTDSFTNEQSGRSYGNTSSGSYGRDGMNSASSDNNRRNNNLRDDAGVSGRGYGNNAQNTEPREPARGSAGVMQSSFGTDNTTTSTFERSQGENFGRGFDGSAQKPEKDHGVGRRQETDRRQTRASAAAGGSGYTAGQNQGFRNDAGGSDNFATEDSTRSSGHSSGHKQGLGQKLVDKAEGLFHHGHKSETKESRAGGGY